MNEDLLGRNGFAQSLAKTINEWQGKQSLVIGLYGEYGSGKTSVKNVVKSVLKEKYGYNNRIIEFNPWQWTGTETIQKAFFYEVGIGIGKTLSKADKKVSYWWNLFSARINAISFINQTLLQIGLVLITVFSVLGFLSSIIENEYFKIGVAIFCGISALISGTSIWLKKWSRSISELYEAKVIYLEKTVTEIKAELSKHLLKLSKSVLVVIDDADRLTPDQVLEVTKLLKANGDFPNIVYLVLCDKKILSASIHSALGVDGSEYLSKIIQVGFNIPEIDRGRLNNILYEEFGKILKETGIKFEEDGQRWMHLYRLGLFPFFDNLRTVKRFVAGLNFNIGLFKSTKGHFEINPIDFCALETLRYFETEFYSIMPSYSYFFTKNPRALENIGRDEERSKLPEKVLGFLSSRNKAHSKEVLLDLFPTLFGPGSVVSDEDKQRSYRICHHDNFDRYFNLTIPQGQIQIDELEEAINHQDDIHSFENKIRSWQEREIVIDGLSRLILRLDEIKRDNIDKVLGAFFNFSDDVPRERGILAIGPIGEMLPICSRLLFSVEDQSQREQIFFNAFELSKGLYLPAKMISWDHFAYTEPEKNRREENPFFTQEKFEAIRIEWVKKAINALSDGTWVQKQNLDFITYWMLKWDASGKSKELLVNRMESRPGFYETLRLLCFKTSETPGAELNSQNYSIDSNLPLEILAEAQFKSRLDQYSKDSESLTEKNIREIIQNALDRKRQGFYS